MKNRSHSPRNRSTASRAKRSLLVSTGSLLLAGNLFADTVSWNSTTGGSFNTNTAAGWNATPLFDSTTIANLSQDFTAAQTWTLDGNKTVNQLNYNDTGASGDVNGTLNAGTGAGTLTFAGTTPTANIASATFTIGANVNLSSGLTKTGAGNLALIGTVSGYTTTTANLNAVTAGTLTFGSASGVQYNWSDKTSGAGTVTFNAGATTAIMPSTVTVAAGKINVVANQLFSVASGDFTKAGNGILSLGNGNGNLTAANVNVTGTAGGLLLNFAPAGVTGTYNVSSGAALGFGAVSSGGTQDTLGNGTASTGIYTIANDLSLSGNGSTLNSTVTGALQSLNNARYNFGGKVTITGATTVSSFSVFTFSVFNGQVTGTGDLTFKGGGGGILHNAHFILNNAANNWTGSTKVLADFGANTLLKTGATNVLPSTTTVILDANNGTAAANRGPNKTGFTGGANAPLLELQDTTQTVTALQTTAVGADRKVVWGGLTTATGGVEKGGTLNLTGTGASISVGALTNSALLLKNVTVNQTGAGSTAAIGSGTTLELVGSSLSGVSTTLETKGVTGTGTLILAGGWSGTVASAGSATLKVGANPAASWITSATGFKLFGAATTNFIDTNGNNATVDAAIVDFAGQAGGFTKSGTGTLTLTNANTYTGGTTVSAGTLQLGNGGTTGKLSTTGAIVNNGNLTINRSNTVVQSTDFSAITGTGSFTQAGTGTTTLDAANTYTGATTVNKGTLNLGGATANGSLASTTLNLGGGTLAYTRTGNTTQSFTTTNITAGASTVTAATGNTLNLGSLSRSVGGGTVKIGTTGGTITTSNANTNGILGGYATFGDTTWAVANGSSAITGLDTYTADTWASTANIDVLTATTTQTSGSTANSLRFNRLGTSTINLSGTNTITSGGILVTSAVTNANVHITGGTLQVGAGNDLVYINNNVAFGFINSNIIDNGAGAGLTVSGTGGLTLTGTNTYTGTTTINTGGKLQLGNAATVGGPTGSLAGAGTIVNNGNLLIFRSNAVVQGTDFGAITGTGSFTQAGAGTTTLNVANTYSGGTSVSKGTLQLNNAAGAGTGTITLNGTTGATLRTGADITVANAITIAPTASSILTISSGAFNSTFSGGISNNSTSTTKLVLDTSNVLTLTGTISGNRPIEKTGTGTLVTGATGTFTGGLTITEGAFQINGGTFSGNNAITLAGGAILRNSTNAAYTFGTLDLSGTGAGTINFGNAAATSQFAFANSSAMDWSGNTLSITGSFFSGSSLRFGNSNSGLNSTQLGLINIAGFNTFGLDANGFLTASAIPEPSTYAALVGLGILGFAATRRRSRSS